MKIPRFRLTRLHLLGVVAAAVSVGALLTLTLSGKSNVQTTPVASTKSTPASTQTTSGSAENTPTQGGETATAQSTGNSISGAPSAKTTKPASASSYQGYQPTPIPTNNYRVKPSFRLVLSAPAANSGNSHGFIITIVPDAGSETSHFTTPERMSTPNGLPCNDSMAYMYDSNLKWQWVCNPYMRADGSMPYGEYPVTFTVTASNGYGDTTKVTVSGTVVYHQDQISYENRY